MRGEVYVNHIWKHKYIQLIFSLEYARSVIAKICHVYDNGLQIEILDPKEYKSVYKRGERVYVERFPGLQMKFIHERDLREYLCQQ